MQRALFYSVLFIFYLLQLKDLHSQDIMDTVVHLHEVRIFAKKPLRERTLVISEIDSITIREHAGGGMEELLSNQSLIYIRSYGYGALSTASFRGSSPGHTRVYWNDLEINDPASGQVDFSLIPVCFVDEIKLYHGGSSMQEGAGGLGGMVKMRTVPRWKDGVKGSLVHNSGSFNSHRTNAGFSAGNERIYSRLKVYRESSDNDFEFINDANGQRKTQRYEGADFLKRGLLGDLYLKDRQNGIFSFHAWIQSNNRNFAPVMSYLGPERKENQKDKFLRLVSQWTNYGDFLRSEISLGLSVGELGYDLQQKGENLIFSSLSKSWSIHSRYEAELKPGPSTRFRSETSFDYKRAEYQDLKFNSGFSADRPEAGTSVSVFHEFPFPVSVSALVRMEVYGDEISPVSPSAGIAYKPEYLKGVTLKTNLSRNYHFPDLNDLHWIPGGNPDLKPETGYLTDASVEYDLPKRHVSVNTSFTAFYSLTDNWILWRPGEYGFWISENIERVKSRGFEQMLKIEFNPDNFKFRLNCNYSFTKATFSGENGEKINRIENQLIYMPVHKLNGNMMVEWDQLKMVYQFLHTGLRFTTTDNDPELALPAFNLHDLKLYRGIELNNFNVGLGFGVYNLFNTHYQVVHSRPMPGRHINFQLRIDF